MTLSAAEAFYKSLHLQGGLMMLKFYIMLNYLIFPLKKSALIGKIKKALRLLLVELPKLAYKCY
jgi:hypothetical protein